MKSRSCRYRTWTAAILLMVLVVPRCLMASDMTGIQKEKEIAQQAPCHGMQEEAGVAQIVSPVTCAQQCEQSAVNTFLVKESDFKQPDYQPLAVVDPQSAFFSLSISTAFHQGWPLDSQFLYSSTPHLYLETGRLRL